jgi:hypothetical protein
MKKILQGILILTLMTNAVSSFAQTTYTITLNTVWKNGGNAPFPDPCIKCTFNISPGVTLSIETNVTFQDVTFNGGSVTIDNKDVTLQTSGSGKNNFNNTNFTFTKNASLIGSAPISLTNSTFRFEDRATMNPQANLDIDNSQLTFVGDAHFESTGPTVNLKNNSKMIAGDGTLASKAYVKFNGSALNIYDNSSIRMGNKNNYYFNWSGYTSKVTNQVINTLNNNLNCGTSGPNACSPPFLYGASLINAQGFGPTSVLPVKLIEFSVTQTSNNNRLLSWTTEMEVKTDEFVIEISNDTKQWSEVGRVQASGSSSSIIRYNFTDASKRSGVLNYRLKMVDVDGQFTYSPVKMINLRTDSKQEVSIYPNPAVKYVVIATKNIRQIGSALQIVNQNGVPVYNARLSSSTTNISLTNFNTGNYIVRILNNDGTSESYKILVTGK